MIDTVKLKIKINNEELEALKVKGGINLRTVHDRDGKELTFIKDINGYIPSYDNNIRWYWENKVKVQDYLWLTFNPSKLYYGHNLFRVNQQQFYEMLSYIHEQFYSVYGVRLCEPVDWIIGTIDLSVTFRFKTHQQVLDTIKLVQAIDTEMVKNNKYETTAYFRRSDYFQYKVYDKYLEFKEHDYYKISINDENRAKELWEFSKGVIVVEFRINEKVFKGVFGRDVLKVKGFLEVDNLGDIIQGLIDKYLPEEAIHMVIEKRKVFDLLKDKVGIGEAVRLYNYYKMMTSQEGTMENWIWNFEVSRQVRCKVRQEFKRIGLYKLLEDEVKMKRIFDIKSSCYLGSPINAKARDTIKNVIHYVPSMIRSESGESY